MESLKTNPAFVAYAITCLVLAANLLFLWGYSGAARGKSKTSMNPEDITTVNKGATVVDSDPPEVARVLRAHSNAMANIVPFLAVGLIYVLVGASAEMARITFGIFAGARVLHSVVYLAGKQPFRSLFFVIGGLTTLVIMGDTIRLLCR